MKKKLVHHIAPVNSARLCEFNFVLRCSSRSSWKKVCSLFLNNDNDVVQVSTGDNGCT